MKNIFYLLLNVLVFLFILKQIEANVYQNSSNSSTSSSSQKQQRDKLKQITEINNKIKELKELKFLKNVNIWSQMSQVNNNRQDVAPNQLQENQQLFEKLKVKKLSTHKIDVTEEVRKIKRQMLLSHINRNDENNIDNDKAQKTNPMSTPTSTSKPQPFHQQKHHLINSIRAISTFGIPSKRYQGLHVYNNICFNVRNRFYSIQGELLLQVNDDLLYDDLNFNLPIPNVHNVPNSLNPEDIEGRTQEMNRRQRKSKTQDFNEPLIASARNQNFFIAKYEQNRQNNKNNPNKCLNLKISQIQIKGRQIMVNNNKQQQFDNLIISPLSIVSNSFYNTVKEELEVSGQALLTSPQSQCQKLNKMINYKYFFTYNLLSNKKIHYIFVSDRNIHFYYYSEKSEQLVLDINRTICLKALFKEEMDRQYYNSRQDDGKQDDSKQDGKQYGRQNGKQNSLQNRYNSKQYNRQNRQNNKEYKEQQKILNVVKMNTHLVVLTSRNRLFSINLINLLTAKKKQFIYVYESLGTQFQSMHLIKFNDNDLRYFYLLADHHIYLYQLSDTRLMKKYSLNQSFRPFSHNGDKRHAKRTKNAYILQSYILVQNEEVKQSIESKKGTEIVSSFYLIQKQTNLVYDFYVPFSHVNKCSSSKQIFVTKNKNSNYIFTLACFLKENKVLEDQQSRQFFIIFEHLTLETSNQLTASSEFNSIDFTKFRLPLIVFSIGLVFYITIKRSSKKSPEKEAEEQKMTKKFQEEIMQKIKQERQRQQYNKGLKKNQ